MQPKPTVNILLVDDKVENLIALESVLEELGQNLVQAHSGSEALKCVLHQDFAVVLMDVQMPGMDGYETAELMRSREKSSHIPIIFLTAINKNDTHVFKGYSVGAVDYVFKPFEPDLLRAKVAAFIEMSRNVTRLQDEVKSRRAAEARLDALNSLLETISRGLMMFISDGKPSEALNHLLENVLTLTRSESGFIGEYIRTGKDSSYVKIHASGGPEPVHARKGGADAFPLLDSDHIQALCDAVEECGRPIRINSPADRASCAEALADVQVESLLAMPLLRGENMVGVVCIANRGDGFPEDLPGLLEPFCSTCATIIEGYRNAQRRQQAEAALHDLNDALERRVSDRTAELETANNELCNEIARRERATEDLARHQIQIEALNDRLRRSMTETHHRVKNSLQMIAAMVDMQLMRGSATLPASDIKQLGIHVRTLAAVHDLLTQESKEGDGQAHFLSALALLEQLLPMLQACAVDRTVVFDIEDIRLSARQGSSLALVVNELVSNSLKYGDGDIRVLLTSHGDAATLQVTDDGPGFPEDFDPASSGSTGMDLVDQLTRWDLGGDLWYKNRDEGGACVIVNIPLQTEAE
jgi:two-component sensor histidine kinase/DNA-binding response OmpR family regulator